MNINTYVRNITFDMALSSDSWIQVYLRLITSFKCHIFLVIRVSSLCITHNLIGIAAEKFEKCWFRIIKPVLQVNDTKLTIVIKAVE